MIPLILAIDTSTEACSVALGLTNDVIYRHEVEPRKHAELVLPMVQSVLEEAGVALKDLQAVAFARGPGAFTGLRIAAGVVQGLAYGAQLPVISVSSLAAMAHRAFREQGWNAVHCAIDARMAEVYWGSFRIRDIGELELLGKEVVCAPTQVAVTAELEVFGKQALQPDEEWTGCGSGWIYEEVLREQIGPVKAVWQDCLPHSIDVIALARTAWQRGEARPAFEAQPVYLRDSVVQVRSSG